MRLEKLELVVGPLDDFTDELVIAGTAFASVNQLAAPNLRILLCTWEQQARAEDTSRNNCDPFGQFFISMLCDRTSLGWLSEAEGREHLPNLHFGEFHSCSPLVFSSTDSYKQ